MTATTQFKLATAVSMLLTAGLFSLFGGQRFILVLFIVATAHLLLHTTGIAISLVRALRALGQSKVAEASSEPLRFPQLDALRFPCPECGTLASGVDLSIEEREEGSYVTGGTVVCPHGHVSDVTPGELRTGGE